VRLLKQIIFLFGFVTIVTYANTDICNKKIQTIKYDAKNGDEAKQYIMGILYQNGICLERNITKSIKWFSLAEKKGYPLARYTLGDIYHFGEGVTIDNKKAEQYYLKILKDKNLEILTRMGNIHLVGKDFEHNASIAKRFYMIAAEKNFTPALNNIGMMYFLGNGVDKNLTKAIEYLGKAAVQNHKNAQFYLAISLSKIDNEKFHGEIMKWLKKSANNNFQKAQLLLGLGYISGENIDVDMKKAKYWIQKAKDQNSTKAAEIWNKHELWRY